MRRNPSNEYAPGAEFDEEQHIQGLQPDRLHGEEVARHDRLGLRSQELRPGRSRASRRGTQALPSQQGPDRGCADPNAKLAEFPGDPDAAPAGVLPRHPQDEPSDRRVNRWSAGLALLVVGPLSSHQLTVPAKQRLRRDEERCPPIPGNGSAGCGQQDAVEHGEPGTADLAAQHPKLLPEHQNLQVLRAVTGAREDQQADERSDQQPEHERHQPMVRSPCSRHESEIPRPTGLRPGPAGLLAPAVLLPSRVADGLPGGSVGNRNADRRARSTVRDPADRAPAPD